MNILLPIQITPEMIRSGTNIPELDPLEGEILWVASGSYVVDDRRVFKGAVYVCVRDYTASSSSKPPDQDFIHWLYKEPTNRMSPFDDYIYTSARRKGEVIYVLTPGFFNGLAIHGLEADFVEITLKDSSDDTILFHRVEELWEQAFGEWEYLFGNLQQSDKFTSFEFPVHPYGELEIKIVRNNPDVEASVGFISVGQWQTLLAPMSQEGGTQYGVEVTPKDYSYFRRNEDGTYVRRQGRNAKIINASVKIDSSEGPRAASILKRILNTPVAIEASDLPKYGHISTVGFVTGTVITESWGITRVNLKIDGNV